MQCIFVCQNGPVEDVTTDRSVMAWLTREPKLVTTIAILHNEGMYASNLCMPNNS